MGKKVEIVGKKFGRLFVLKETEKRSKNGEIYYLCKCDCGNTKEINGTSLRKNRTLSCGCYNKEIINKAKKRIYKNKRLYELISSIKQRCYNKNNKAYKNYGGRGIKVCDEWKNDNNKFVEWALNSGYKKGLWIDRINNNGNYEPDNCRWITPKEQQNNKRTNHFLTYDGITHTIKEWSEIKNINYATLMRRVNNNQDLFSPIDVSKRHNFKK